MSLFLIQVYAGESWKQKFECFLGFFLKCYLWIHVKVSSCHTIKKISIISMMTTYSFALLKLQNDFNSWQIASCTKDLVHSVNVNYFAFVDTGALKYCNCLFIVLKMSIFYSYMPFKRLLYTEWIKHIATVCYMFTLGIAQRKRCGFINVHGHLVNLISVLRMFECIGNCLANTPLSPCEFNVLWCRQPTNTYESSF